MSDGTVLVDGDSLTPADVEAVTRDGATVAVSDSARSRVRESRARIEDVLASGEAVYGVNTGFGQLVDTRIESGELRQLQTNLIRSHASGAGDELDVEAVRAMLITRVNALVKGYSGIREKVIDLFVSMLNEHVHPVVRSRGSLGASGDLAPLAHMSLVLIGEGEALVGGGGPEHEPPERLPGDEALASADLEPVELEPKEGLALINGTQLTTGLAALAVVDAERVLRAADVAGALTTEVTMGTTANCDPAIMDVRPHPGQATAARNIKRLTADSGVVESHRNCDRVQDAYSVRCLPQVHGAIREAVEHLRDAVEVELNSATDNPLVFDAAGIDDRASGTERTAVVSGGNFHGEPLSLRLDYVRSALTELAAISERRVDRMVNPNIQDENLPPFLTEHPGLHSGLMIPQYTAAALLNELRGMGTPATDNTPVSGGQEDHVSMSATSAMQVRRAVENTRQIVAVELLTGAQAAEFLEDDLDHGVGTDAAYDVVRDVVPPLIADRPLHGDMDAVSDIVSRGLLDEVVTDALGEPLE